MKTKKNLFTFVTFLLLGLALPPMLFAQNIPIRGFWGNKNIRSLLPSPPEVYLENQSLFIYFPGYLSDLTVVVEDENGNIVYSDIIFITPASPRVILLENMEAGSYSITLSHTLGNLDGFFEIE